MNQLLYRGEPIAIVGKTIQYTYEDGEYIIAVVKQTIISDYSGFASVEVKILFSTIEDIWVGRDIHLYISNKNIEQIKQLDFEIGL